MTHHIADDSDTPFRITKKSRINTDIVTIGSIIAAVIAGTLFYSSVNNQLGAHTAEILAIKNDVHEGSEANRHEREENIRFRQELTTKIDYLVQGRRGNPPPAGTSTTDHP